MPRARGPAAGCGARGVGAERGGSGSPGRDVGAGSGACRAHREPRCSRLRNGNSVGPPPQWEAPWPVRCWNRCRVWALPGAASRVSRPQTQLCKPGCSRPPPSRPPGEGPGGPRPVATSLSAGWTRARLRFRDPGPLLTLLPGSYTEAASPYRPRSGGASRPRCVHLTGSSSIPVSVDSDRPTCALHRRESGR